MDDGHGVKLSELMGCEKSSWPEVVGMVATPAVTKIMQDRPDVSVEVQPPGNNVLPGDNPKRVCVFINDLGAVAKIPYVG
jgi:hypothetical protein